MCIIIIQDGQKVKFGSFPKLPKSEEKLGAGVYTASFCSIL